MKIYPYLYVGSSVEDREKTIHNLKTGRKLLNLQVIMLAGGHNELEIISAIYLKQKFYKKNPPYIIGITKDYDEAVQIVAQIANESLAVQNNCCLKEYLLSRIETKKGMIE